MQEKSSHFDVIVLDLNMPIASGFEAIKNINNLYDEKTKLFKLDSNMDIKLKE